jgi:hypothetical protein
MSTKPALNLGAWRRIDGREGGNALGPWVEAAGDGDATINASERAAQLAQERCQALSQAHYTARN